MVRRRQRERSSCDGYQLVVMNFSSSLNYDNSTDRVEGNPWSDTCTCLGVQRQLVFGNR
jgi:hypothetical protein